MSEIPHRFAEIRDSARRGCVLAVVGAVGLAIVGAYAFFGEPDRTFNAYLLAFGLIASAAVTGGLSLILWNLLGILMKVEDNSFRSYSVLRDLHENTDKQQIELKRISDSVQLSDFVLAITHRGRERTALRLAINEEIIRGDWEAAYALVEQLAARHGYKNEAARLREEVDQSRARQSQNVLHEAIEQITAHMDAHDWDWARREMDRLVAEHPDSPEVRELPALFAQKRNEHKRRLLKAWDESVQRSEVDNGIALLKQLDQYLTPNEAAALAESARGVFRAKLHNLGVQFSLAVTGQNWEEAYGVGQQIVSEFPNSRMAQEVRDRIHVLAKRAAKFSDEPETVNAAQE